MPKDRERERERSSNQGYHLSSFIDLPVLLQRYSRFKFRRVKLPSTRKRINKGVITDSGIFFVPRERERERSAHEVSMSSRAKYLPYSPLPPLLTLTIVNSIMDVTMKTRPTKRIYRDILRMKAEL